VWATANAAIEKEKPKEEKITYVDVKKTDVPLPPPPKHQPPPPKDAPAVAGPQKPGPIAPAPPKGFQVLKAPIDIPNVIPNIDLNRKATNADDFSGKGVEGGIAKGVVGGTGPLTASTEGGGTAFSAYQVEKPAKLRSDSPKPSYPETLRSAGIEGGASVEFVVDTTGRVEVSTFKVTREDNGLFTAEVRRVLPRLRFLPAEAGGHKVRQLVEQPFTFSIR